MLSRRSLISVFAICCIWIQVKANTGIRFPYGLSLTPPRIDEAPAKGRTVYQLYYLSYLADWTLDHFGWFAGLSTYWRMFDPPPSLNRQLQITANMTDGSQLELPFANHLSRSFLQRNFTDFREAKHEWNLYDNAEGLRQLTQHICHHYSSGERAVTDVRVDIISNKILDPETAQRSGSYYGERQDTPAGVFPCE